MWRNGTIYVMFYRFSSNEKYVYNDDFEYNRDSYLDLIKINF